MIFYSVPKCIKSRVAGSESQGIEFFFGQSPFEGALYSKAWIFKQSIHLV